MNGKVLKYQLTYNDCNLDKFKTKNKWYMSSLIIKMMGEVERGFIPSKVFKATKKGTSIRYKCITGNSDDLDVLNNFISEYNKKHGANVPEFKFER